MSDHDMTWNRNGTPRPIPGGATRWVGTTKAQAACSCGWTGSWFPTRNIEFYDVVGEREFATHTRTQG